MNILFVCLGNICRSPAAEGVMQKKISSSELADLVTCDSAGTAGHHEGEEADPRMMDHALERGYKLTSKSRAFRTPGDFDKYDYIITMDEQNYDDIVSRDHENIYDFKIKKMTSFCSKLDAGQVPDPYYGGADGFENVLDILEDACDGLINYLKTELL